MTTQLDDKARPHPPARTINIFINDQKKKVHDDTMTGRELKALGEIPDANQLFHDLPGHGDDAPVADDQPMHLKSGMRFYDVPVGNLG